jgi:polyhydroxyalkanoate synthase subunit PhaC
VLRNMTDAHGNAINGRTNGRGPHPLPLFLSLATRITGENRERMAAFLEGLKRYQETPRPGRVADMMPAGRLGGVRLLRVGGPDTGPALVIVPSLINAPAVLDLAPDRSFVRFLAGEGFRTYMVDWGAMGKSERRLGLAGLVSARLVPLVRAVREPVALVGYCLGGTLALAAGQLLGEQLRRLALIASPWHFDGFPPEARTHARQTWEAARPVGQALGAVPVSLLNPLFWSLDEEAVVAKFEALSRRPPEDPHIGWFAAVEDWANSGAPLTCPAARDLFVHGFGADRIGRGRWQVGGQRIAPEAITAPIFDVGATNDRIVPPGARLRLSGVHRADVPSGHVGMVVGSAARGALWEPLSNWLHGR